MSEKNTKIIIGLTGNIATGKSVVRKMLQRLGAFGIDADTLGHRALDKGAPGYEQVINEFGHHILDSEMEIDRKKLGQIVFSNPSSLKNLEAILHPLVRQAIEFLIKKSTHRVIVIEAIKLLDSPIKELTDSIWVTISSEDIQLERLSDKRGMSSENAKEIMDNQTSQDEKVKFADSIIINDKSLEDTWNQVQRSWYEIMPDQLINVSEIDKEESNSSSSSLGIEIIRAAPKHAQGILEFLEKNQIHNAMFSDRDVIKTFGERAYMLLKIKDKIIAVVGWQVENLVTVIDEIWLDNKFEEFQILNKIFISIEKYSKELQAEAMLLILDQKIANDISGLDDLGYQIVKIEDLKVKAWREAAQEQYKQKSKLLFKQLRMNRIMRPL